MKVKIISGGQTGADRGALEAAFKLGRPYGGWVPRGGRAEDGVVPTHFELWEHPSSDYPPRTYANVRDSDATLLVSRLPLQQGSRLTQRLCHDMERPLLVLNAHNVLDPSKRPGELGYVRRWLPQLARWIKDCSRCGGAGELYDQLGTGVAPKKCSACRGPESPHLTLNVAGSRESSVPGLQAAVSDLVERLLVWADGSWSCSTL